MAIQIKDSGLQIFVRIGDIEHQIAKEGLGSKEYKGSSGDGIWLYPENGEQPLQIPVAELSDPGGFTTSKELIDFVDGLIASITGMPVTLTQENLAGNGTTKTPIPSNTNSVTVCPANPDRKEVALRNTSTHNAYVKKGTGATTSDQPLFAATNTIIIIDDYDGIVTAIWDGDTDGDMLIEETSF